MGCMSVAIVVIIILFGDAENTSTLALSRTSPCSCIYDGGYYNLRSLGIKDEPMIAVTKDGEYVYGFSPCIPFTKEGACKNVAVCTWPSSEIDPNAFIALGRNDNMTCVPATGDKNIKVQLVFHQPGKEQKQWITTIKMKCNKTLEKPKFTIVNPQAVPVLQVEHKCCCADMCPDFSPLPTPSSSMVVGGIIGSVFGGIGLVLVIIIVVAYVVKRCKKKNIEQGHEQHHPRYGAIPPNPPYDDDDDRSEENDEDSDDDRLNEHDDIPPQPPVEHAGDRERPESVPVQVEGGREDQQSSCASVVPASPGPVEHP